MKEAKELIKTLNLEEEITITSVNADYFANEYFAKRPAKERLLTKNRI